MKIFAFRTLVGVLLVTLSAAAPAFAEPALDVTVNNASNTCAWITIHSDDTYSPHELGLAIVEPGTSHRFSGKGSNRIKVRAQMFRDKHCLRPFGPFDRYVLLLSGPRRLSIDNQGDSFAFGER
jgi:hypothetical protein